MLEWQLMGLLVSCKRLLLLQFVVFCASSGLRQSALLPSRTRAGIRILSLPGILHKTNFRGRGSLYFSSALDGDSVATDGSGDEWYQRTTEDDIYTIKQGPTPSGFQEIGMMFDSLYNEEEGDASAAHSISGMTLREISSHYYFSLDYLGDFVAQLGCRIPVDVDSAVGNLMTGEQIYTLLQAINTLDPMEANLEYDAPALWQLAKELDIPLSGLLLLCERHEINLPFGDATTLHSTVAMQVRRLAEEEDFDVIDVDEFDSSADI